MAFAWVGTSGWQYRAWKNSFYEGTPTSEWLEFAASRFSALEADGTFYRLQKKTTFENWAMRTPDGFRFALRGHRYTTHNKKLIDSEPTIVKQKQPAAGLGEKLGVVLWQLPAAFKKNLARLQSFAEQLQVTWPETRHSMEFRHRSWFDEEVAQVMSEFRLANTISDAGKWPRWDAVTTDLVYVRLHGKPHTYVSGYSGEELDEWARRTLEWIGEGREVYVFFDNDAGLRAPVDAMDLISRIATQNTRAFRRNPSVSLR